MNVTRPMEDDPNYDTTYDMVKDHHLPFEFD